MAIKDLKGKNRGMMRIFCINMDGVQNFRSEHNYIMDDRISRNLKNIK